MVIERAEFLFGTNPIRFVTDLFRSAILHVDDRRFRILVREGLEPDAMVDAITRVCDDYEEAPWELPSTPIAWCASGQWQPSPAGTWLARDEYAPPQAVASARWTPVPPSR